MRAATSLDGMDFKILAYLQQEGRATNVEVAEAVGLSPSPCLSRTKRLQALGVIAGYGVHLSLASLGETILIFVEVTINKHRREDLRRFEAVAGSIREVMECYNVSGGFDYLLKIVTRDTRHFQSVMEALLNAEIGIERFQSYIVLREPFIKQEYPLDLLFEAGQQA